MPIDYNSARAILENEFGTVEKEALEGKAPSAPDAKTANHFDVLFASKTQAYREAYVGCILARLADRKIDVAKPYVNQGEGAYNGRTLNEKVVSPFLHEKQIPSSKAPFLSALRRSVQFDKATRKGIRDKEDYDSFLALIDVLKNTNVEGEILALLRYTLVSFIKLRIAADVKLSKLQRVSLEQYGQLIKGLLGTPSGGRFPVMLVAATLDAIKKAYRLGWDIQTQGINVADSAAGAGGDITVTDDGKTILAIEVTEWTVDKTRVISTFKTKISKNGIEDYLFLTTSKPEDDAVRQARQYFSQGHEVNFFQVLKWIVVVLATIGKAGRAAFNDAMLEKLGAEGVPATLKLAWNKQLESLTTV
jgi:hypothetical protein